MKKFAMMIMGPAYKPNEHQCHFKTGNYQTSIYTVTNMNEAIELAKALAADGVGCIEVCGAFGEEGAKQLIEATDGKIPIGFVTHLAQQDALFEAYFGK